MPFRNFLTFIVLTYTRGFEKPFFLAMNINMVGYKRNKSNSNTTLGKYSSISKLGLSLCCKINGIFSISTFYALIGYKTGLARMFKIHFCHFTRICTLNTAICTLNTAICILNTAICILNTANMDTRKYGQKQSNYPTYMNSTVIFVEIMW